MDNYSVGTKSIKRAVLVCVLAATLGVIGIGVYSAALAQTAVAVGGIAGKVLLSDAEKKARDLLRQAESTGDYLLWQFATNMLRLIEQARKEAFDVLDKTVEVIGSERNRLFYQIHELMGKAETNLQDVFMKADELTANFAEIVRRFPLADKSADLFTIQPSVLPPIAVEKIVRFLGPGMGEARVVATLPDGKQVPLTVEKATSAYLKLKPLDYASADGKANFTEIKVEYTTSKASPICPVCSDTRVTRVIPFVVPQKVPGKVRLVHVKETSKVIRDSFLVELNAQGKRIEVARPVVIPPHLREAEFQIDTAAVTASMQGNKLVKDAWGHSGSCNGPDVATLRRDGFIYKVYAGATCRVSGCRGGNQTCRIAVPLIKTLVNKVEVAGEFQDLSWSGPTILTPDPAVEGSAANSMQIELERPDGSRIRFPPSERNLAVTVTTEPSKGTLRVVPFIGSHSGR